MVNVRDVALMVNERLDELAAAYPAFAVIEPVIVHVPASTNVTAPEEELTVHTEVVELEYDFVPAPADGLDDIVGAGSPSWYGPLSPDSVSVRVKAVIVKLIALAVADEKPPPAVMDAEIVQVPASTNETRPEEASIVQTDVVELEYDFVPLPTPADGVEVIVGFVPASNA